MKKFAVAVVGAAFVAGLAAIPAPVHASPLYGTEQGCAGSGEVVRWCGSPVFDPGGPAVSGSFRPQPWRDHLSNGGNAVLTHSADDSWQPGDFRYSRIYKLAPVPKVTGGAPVFTDVVGTPVPYVSIGLEAVPSQAGLRVSVYGSSSSEYRVPIEGAARAMGGGDYFGSGPDQRPANPAEIEEAFRLALRDIGFEITS